MAAVIAITNQKGGVGKTTTAVNLAFYLAKSGQRVLLVDGDPQGNATSGLAVDKHQLKLALSSVLLGEATVAEATVATKFENLHLLPTLPDLADVEVQLAAGAEHRFSRLKKSLTKLEDYDVVLIDCPPSLSLLTVNAFIAADYLLLPVQAEFYALEGLGQLLETTKLIKERMNAKLDIIGVVLTMYDERTNLGQQVARDIRGFFKDRVFSTVIPRNIRLGEAPSHGLPVILYDAKSRGADAYVALAHEFLARHRAQASGAPPNSAPTVSSDNREQE